MNSSIISILDLLKTAKNLNSAGFSGGYNLTAEKADEYFDDLIMNSSGSNPIFSGIIIAEEQKNKAFTIVDGIQRIITFNLLLAALCYCAKNTTLKNEQAREKIFKRYLTFNDDTRLNLISDEQEIFRKIIFSIPISDKEKNTNIFKAFERFVINVKELRVSATELFKVISRIQFIVVFSEPSAVSARELYQSLNKAKSEKIQIRLITSFLNQNCEENLLQWNNSIKRYKNADLNEKFLNFMVDFLTVQNNGKIPANTKVYDSFKHYFYTMNKYQSAETIVDNITRYSKIYLRIIQSDFEDFEIQKRIITINENNGQDAYPYLMEVFDDLENGHIERQIFLDILDMIIDFIKNRQENEDFKVTFASLSSDLNKMIALRSFSVEKPKEEVLSQINEIKTEKRKSYVDSMINKKVSINEINNDRQKTSFGV